MDFMEADLPPQKSPDSSALKAEGRSLSPESSSVSRRDNNAYDDPPSDVRRITTETAPDPANPVFQKALEILRREMPPEDKTVGAAPQSESVVTAPEPLPSSPVTPSANSDGQRIETIPARMLNEFVYCQRLFYYEFVEGVFVESADTLRGGAIHQRVDSGSGALPAAKRKTSAGKKKADEASPAEVDSAAKEPQENAEPETIHSRSVQMGSERLGVIAKMDLVESKAEKDDLLTALEVC